MQGHEFIGKILAFILEITKKLDKLREELYLVILHVLLDGFEFLVRERVIGS